MKKNPPFPGNKGVSRRNFLAGTTAGVAGGLLIPAAGAVAEAQRGRGGRLFQALRGANDMA